MICINNNLIESFKDWNKGYFVDVVIFKVFILFTLIVIFFDSLRL